MLVFQIPYQHLTSKCLLNKLASLYCHQALDWEKILTFKAPSKICSRRHYFVFYLSEKTSLDFSCETSGWHAIHMKCQDLFSLKEKKKYQNCRLLQLWFALQRIIVLVCITVHGASDKQVTWDQCFRCCHEIGSCVRCCAIRVCQVGRDKECIVICYRQTEMNRAMIFLKYIILSPRA